MHAQATMHSLTQDQHKELYALVSWVRSIPEFPLADGTRPSEYSDNADPPSVEVLMCALLEPDANCALFHVAHKICNMKAISVAVKTKDDQTDLWHSLLDMVSRYCKLPALRDLQMESPAVRCLVVLRALLHIAVHLRSSDKGAQWKVFRIGLLKNILSLLPTSIQTCLQGLLNRSEENEPSLSADIGPYTFDGDESVPRAGRFIPVVDLEEFLYALAVWTQSYPGFPVIVEIDNDVPLPGDMLFFLEQIEVTNALIGVVNHLCKMPDSVSDVPTLGVAELDARPKWISMLKLMKTKCLPRIHHIEALECLDALEHTNPEEWGKLFLSVLCMLLYLSMKRTDAAGRDEALLRIKKLPMSIRIILHRLIGMFWPDVELPKLMQKPRLLDSNEAATNANSCTRLASFLAQIRQRNIELEHQDKEHWKNRRLLENEMDHLQAVHNSQIMSVETAAYNQRCDMQDAHLATVKKLKAELMDAEDLAVANQQAAADLTDAKQELERVPYLEQQLASMEEKLQRYQEKLGELQHFKTAYRDEHNAHVESVDELHRLEGQVKAIPRIKKEVAEWKERAIQAEQALNDCQDDLRVLRCQCANQKILLDAYHADHSAITRVSHNATLSTATSPDTQLGLASPAMPDCHGGDHGEDWMVLQDDDEILSPDSLHEAQDQDASEISSIDAACARSGFGYYNGCDPDSLVPSRVRAMQSSLILACPECFKQITGVPMNWYPQGFDDCAFFWEQVEPNLWKPTLWSAGNLEQRQGRLPWHCLDSHIPEIEGEKQQNKSRIEKASRIRCHLHRLHGVPYSQMVECFQPKCKPLRRARAFDHARMSQVAILLDGRVLQAPDGPA